MQISCILFGSVRFRTEQISAVTDSVPEEWRLDLTITIISLGIGSTVSECSLVNLN